MHTSWGHALAALGFASTTLAQTFTTCNPTLKECPSDKGLDSATFYTDFTKSSSLPDGWNALTGTNMAFDDKLGAVFSINKAGQAPTIETDFYFFFGTVEVVLQSSPGAGIISSIVLESDDLDEIDLEFFGTGQYATSVETNFFGKGNTSAYDRATYWPMPAPATPQSGMTTYKIDWNEERIEFLVNGQIIRTLAYDDPLTLGGLDYPQTPMRLKLGNWAGGAPSEPEGTVQWAGGATTFAGVPYNMYIQSVSIVNNNPASSYTYSDMSGSYESITLGGASGNGSIDKASGTASAQPASSSNLPGSGTAVSRSHAAQATGTGTDKGTTLDSTPTTLNYANKAGSNSATTTAATANASPIVTGVRSSPSPSQQGSSDASLNKVTMASISIFTLAMCFWML